MRHDPTVRALCLAARTSPDEFAQAELRTLGPTIDWPRLAQLAHLHDVLALMAGSVPAAFAGPPTAAVASGGPPAGWVDAARRRRLATSLRNATLGDALREVLGALADTGIEVIPVKGLVVAEWAYDDPSVRPAADLDILVRRRDLAVARAAIARLGYRQSEAPGFAILAHEFHDPPWFRGDGPEQLTLEVHWSLWSERFARLPVDNLWARSSVRPILGTRARLLSPEDTLLHLAIHRSRSPLRLRWVVDVAEAVRRHHASLDWDVIVDRARTSGAATATWTVLDLARRLLDAPVPAGVEAALRPGPVHRRVLEVTCGETALFRPAKDLHQQPHLTFRVAEQDGALAIARAFATSVARSVRRVLHERGVARIVQGDASASPSARPERPA